MAYLEFVSVENIAFLWYAYNLVLVHLRALTVSHTVCEVAVLRKLLV